MKETLQAIKNKATSTRVRQAELQLVKEVKELVKESRTLAKEVKNLKDLEFVQILKRPWRFLLLSFGKGLMVGFGSVLGASLVVGIFFFIMAQISLVPIVGDFVNKVMNQIELPQADKADTGDVVQQFNERQAESQK